MQLAAQSVTVTSERVVIGAITFDTGASRRRRLLQSGKWHDFKYDPSVDRWSVRGGLLD